MKVKLEPSGEQYRQRGLGDCRDCRARQRMRQLVADNKNDVSHFRLDIETGTLDLGLNKVTCLTDQEAWSQDDVRNGLSAGNDEEQELLAIFENIASQVPHESECRPDIALMNAECRTMPLISEIKARRQKILDHIQQEKIMEAAVLSPSNFKILAITNQVHKASITQHRLNSQNDSVKAHELALQSENGADANWYYHYTAPLKALCFEVLRADDQETRYLTKRRLAVLSIQVKAKSLLRILLSENLRIDTCVCGEDENQAASERLTVEVGKLCSEASTLLSHNVSLAKFDTARMYTHYELDLWLFAAFNAARMAHLRDLYTVILESKPEALNVPEIAEYLQGFLDDKLEYSGPEFNRNAIYKAYSDPN